jgi:glycolate oxidase FAD binding subunit
LPSVSEPATVEEAAALLRRATAGRQTVTIDREGGDVVLSTRRLSRLLEHEPGDLTCIVEAGMRLSELRAHLEPHGQMLALDPPGDPTIGACLAGDLSGPRRHRYGAARDLVLGVTVVLADGTVASSGGKVVKNVAGYDLGKLFCGSRGRFGLIARVSLRLHPRPQASATLTAPVGDGADAQALSQAVLRSQLTPSALDLLWPGRLALLFEGRPRAVDAQLDTARQLVGGGEDGGVWDEIAARQGRYAGREPFEPGRLADALAPHAEAVARVAAGTLYLPDERPRAPLPPLHERIRGQLDPDGTLSPR